MAGGTLNYRIELDAADAQAAFEGLQSAGSDLFRSLQRAASALSGGGGFGAMATAVTAAAAAVAGLSGGLLAMANSASQTVDQLEELAAQTGSSVAEISTLRSALVQAGANGDQLQQAFQRMGNTISEVWPEIQKSVDGAAAKIISDQVDIEKATLSLAKAQLDAKGSSTALAQAYLGIEQAAITLAQAQQKVAETTDIAEKNHLDLQQALLSQKQTQTELARFSQQAAQQQINSALGIEGAIQGVADAELALKQARGETVSAETLRQNTIKRAELALQQAIEQRAQAEERASREQEDLALRRRQLQLQEAQAAQAVADAQKRQALETQQAQLVQLQLEQARLAQSEAKKKAAEAELDSQGKLISVHEAQLRLAQARDKQRETEANSIDNLRTAIEGLASGAQGSLGSINASVDNMVKGLIAAVGPGVTALEGLGGNFGDIGRRAPALVPAIHMVADAFMNMKDGALRLAIATKLVGKAAAVDLVDALSIGSAKLRENEARMTALGMVIRDDEKLAEKFNAAMYRLKDALRIVSTQLGQLVTPAFTAALEGMAALIENNRATILAWGTAIRDTVGPVIASLPALLGAAGAAFSLLATVAIAAIRGILVAMGPVGIALVALGVGLGLIIQYWPQIQAAAEPVLKWLSEALAALNEWWKVLKEKSLELWTATRDAAVAAWTAIRETAQPVLDWLVAAWEAVKNAGVATWNAIKAAIDGVLGVLKAVIEAIGNAIDKLRQLLFESKDVGTPGGGLSDTGGFAGGGMVGGRGTGTSDSNLAWVSRGEHIMPARAVRQPGVLALLEALRRGGDLRRLLDGMGRFALGGPVGMPAIAGGGLSSMSNVTIQFPGLPAISGLRAPSDVVDELRKAAAMAQVRSGGRKPSRYT